MPSTLPDAVYSTLLEALPSDRAVSRDDLRRHGLPRSVAHFLEHALDRRLELETARILELAPGWVDHGQPEVSRARQTYLQVLARHAHYPSSEWPRALRQAVQLVVAYLIRPVPTLIHFVFGDKRGELPADDVLRRVSYFTGYSHLRTAVGAFVDLADGQPVSRRGLAEALEAVDRRFCVDFDADQWKSLVRPLTDLAEHTASGGLPAGLVSQFFESRGGEALASGVRGYARARDLVELTPSQVEAAIDLAVGDGEDDELPDHDEVLTGQPRPTQALSLASAPMVIHDEEAAGILGNSPSVPDMEEAAQALPEFPAHEPPDGFEVEPDPEPASRHEDDTDDDEEDTEEPLWARFRSPEPPAPPEPEEDDDEEEDDSVPLWKRFQSSVVEPDEEPFREAAARRVRLHPSAPTPEPPEISDDTASLEFAVLGPAAWQRDTFIDRLFNGSSEGYFEALERLRTASDWRAAGDIIAVDIFRANRVNIYDEAAIDFTNAVEEQFKKR